MWSKIVLQRVPIMLKKSASWVYGVLMLLSKVDGMVVVDSPSAGFVSNVWCCTWLFWPQVFGLAQQRATTSPLTPLAMGSSSVVGDRPRQHDSSFRPLSHFRTLFAMSFLEKPRRITSLFRESAWNKLVSAFWFEVLLALVSSLASSALSFVN